MSSTSFTEITYDVEGPAAIITLNRPERLNAFTGTMMNEMIEAFADSNNDTAVPTDAFSMLAAQPQQQLAGVFAQVRVIMAGPSIQARCLECPAVAPARIEPKDLTLLGLLKEWLS